MFTLLILVIDAYTYIPWATIERVPPNLGPNCPLPKPLLSESKVRNLLSRLAFFTFQVLNLVEEIHTLYNLYRSIEHKTLSMAAQSSINSTFICSSFPSQNPSFKIPKTPLSLSLEPQTPFSVVIHRYSWHQNKTQYETSKTRCFSRTIHCKPKIFWRKWGPNWSHSIRIFFWVHVLEVFYFNLCRKLRWLWRWWKHQGW